ncbi:hypothetical protein [Heyndrickxia vini]|nr:hypothetical protein [Heyndrickxia vini]
MDDEKRGIYMFEIKNPFSRKRYTLKQIFYKNFTRIVVPLLKKIPLMEDLENRPKFVPQFIIQLRQMLEYWDDESWTNNNPKGVEVNLLSLYVSEYVPIEDINKLNKGLKMVFKTFKPKRFNMNDISRIDDFCNKVSQSIHGERWSNFGLLEVDKGSDLSEFVKYIEVHATHVASTIILEFIITPSQNYINEIKKLVEKNIVSETVLTPTFKKFFSFWGSSSKLGSNIKKGLIEDLLLELKWRTLQEISKYFDMYFFKNKLVPPSIEVYRVTQTSCKYKYGENENINEFWDSIGMGRSNIREISKDGFWQLVANRGDSNLDSSIKILCNSEIPRKSGYQSLDFQIIYHVRELSMNLLPILVMRDYALALSKQIGISQKKTFSSIKKENPKYKKLINIRYELEQNLHLLKRFKNEKGEREFERVKRDIMHCLNNFEPANPKFNEKRWAEIIVDNTRYLIDRTYSYSQNFSKIIDDTVKLLEIKTNNSLRKRTFWLTIITVILSLIATSFAGISLYLQLNQDTHDTVTKLVDTFKNFFF